MTQPSDSSPKASKPPKSDSPKMHSPRSSEVARLRALQRSAIASMDLVSAEEIQRKIASLSDDTFDADLKLLHDRFIKTVLETIDSYLEAVKTLKTKETTGIIELRRRIQGEFELMKSRHLARLVTLETESAALRLKESQRLIPEYEEMVQQSKAAARIGDFETAKQFQGMAAALAEKELEKRLATVDFDVRGKTETLLQTQQKDIEVLARKLNDGIRQIQLHTIKSMDARSELKDVALLGVLNNTAKELVGIAPPWVDATVYHREFENDLIAKVLEAGLPLPRKMRQNPKTAMRASAKSPRKERSPKRL
jgi:hypothetical protein